jgi:hypothetical protein
MGSTKVETPTPPAAPSTTSSVQDWIQNYPAVFNLQQQYAPQEAAQQVALAQQYAAPMGNALRLAQEQMYPNETALSNSLTQQAQEGMSSDVPEWMKQEYLSNMNAQLGTNAGSPIGADYMSRGLMQQKQDWQRYYQNMGMSIAGKQPVYQAGQPQTTNQTSTFTPASVMGSNNQNYGNYSNAYTSMYGANAQTASQGNPWMNAGAGIVGQGLGGWMGNTKGFWGQG